MNIAKAQPGPLHGSALLIALLPIAATLLATFLAIGVALPVLPLHIQDNLGFGAFIIGIIAGSQSATAFVSRFGAGRYADRRGPKRAVAAGLACAMTAGFGYLSSVAFLSTPSSSAALLLVARCFIGAGESFVVTGALSWGLSLCGPTNSGKVMAWLGLPMNLGYGAGAPLGTILYEFHGLEAVGCATMLLSLAGLLLIAGRQTHLHPTQGSASMRHIISAVGPAGIGLAFCSVGFGAIMIFVALLFAQHGWGGAWAPFTAMSIAFMVTRIFFGHLPDRIGGARVALVSVIVEVLGLTLIWTAPSAWMAVSGSAISGVGFSLIFPSFGVEAVRRAPPHGRGLVMGTYTACLDLGLGLSGPTLGLVASGAGVRSVFLVSGLVVAAAGYIAFRLMNEAAKDRISATSS